MDLPEFITNQPLLDIPFPPDVVEAYAIKGAHGMAVFFVFHKAMELPPHSHKGQWGTVLEGELTLTIGGETRIYRPGESYNIPSGVEHSAVAPAGLKVIDVFEEPDRYPLKG
ncbi:cupin [Actibacterium mucosum KCTC 23349]|uniref:Cupin n=1 Tax=Actibacterium mucosum KCTC 23349 TaxID=1454373 RepID=A0A037ZK53_9RHOB|nr:cupin domain-containing protein [Actibacterium mucosum]KAJ56815.1 cupin [Actibacterium mucosum KCTC 23349]